MRHGIGGLFSPLLIKRNQVLNLSEYNHIKINAPSQFINFIASSYTRENQYFYDEQEKVLFIKNSNGLEGEDIIQLCFFVDDEACQIIQSYKPLLFSNKAPEVLQFIQKNQYEMSAQIIAGH